MSGRSLLIRGGRIIDPSQGMDMLGDLLVVDGRVGQTARGGLSEPVGADAVISAEGRIVCPGFVDLHCHLREPGFEEKETVATGTEAAARGGFTAVCCMPNTRPPIDSPRVVGYVKERAGRGGVVRVFPVGCITLGQRGEGLVDMEELAEAGVVAFSDDGRSVANPELMRRALEHSRALGLPISDHCEDETLTGGGVMNAGDVSARLGLKGIPAGAEESIIARDIDLARITGARLHIAHASTAGSVELIRRAKEDGLQVTAEVTPHHLTLTEERVVGCDTNAKVNPPLRTQEDTEALLEGLKQGIIDAIATDHAPHAPEGKACGFDRAAFGISGLETALGVLLGLVHRGRLDLATLVSKLASEPARLLPALRFLGTLREGARADLTIFDPEAEWVVDPEVFASKGKNSPWAGCRLKGKVVLTLVGGRIVYRDEATFCQG
jgi:dihydroorotase